MRADNSACYEHRGHAYYGARVFLCLRLQEQLRTAAHVGRLEEVGISLRRPDKARFINAGGVKVRYTFALLPAHLMRGNRLHPIFRCKPPLPPLQSPLAASAAQRRPLRRFAITLLPLGRFPLRSSTPRRSSWRLTEGTSSARQCLSRRAPTARLRMMCAAAAASPALQSLLPPPPLCVRLCVGGGIVLNVFIFPVGRVALAHDNLSGPVVTNPTTPTTVPAGQSGSRAIGSCPCELGALEVPIARPIHPAAPTTPLCIPYRFG